MTWSINHILSAGYGTGYMFDTIYYSGTDINSNSISNPSQYSSISQSTSEVIDSSSTVTYHFNEAINFAPTLISHNVVWTGSSDTAKVYVNVSQANGWANEPEQLVIDWGNSASTTQTLVASAPASFVATHTYSTTGTKDISFQLTNIPDSSSITAGSTSVPALSYTISINPSPSPGQYAQLNSTNDIYLNFSTVHDIVSGVTLSVSGSTVATFSPDSQTGSLRATPSQVPEIGSTAFTATWIFDGANYSYSVTYGAPEYPLLNSPYITTMFSSNATHSYPISLSGVPSGTGFYQQLLTIGNSTNPISKYGINKAGSNIQFTSGNNTLLYAWIQSINSTAMQIWIKNYYGNSVVDMQVLPSFENLFSVNGYLGFNLTYFNAPSVFLYATNFHTSQGWTYSGNASFSSTGLYVGSSGTGYAYTNQSYLNVNATFYGTFAIQSSSDNDNQFGLGQDSATFIPVADDGAVLLSNYGFDSTAPGYQINNGGTENTVAGSASWPTGNALYSVTPDTAYYSGTLISQPPHVLDESVPITFSVNSANNGAFHALYLIVSQNLSMPTISSIGTGSVFQANATTFTHSPYSTVAPYAQNPLDEIYTYDIYDSFSDNYVSMISNQSWTYLQNSGYGTYDPNTNTLTFSGVSGIGEVSASYLEPSQQLGQPSFVTLSLSAYGSSLFSGFSYSVAYVPYSSNTTYYDNGTSSDVQIPFGSTMNITVFDAWNHPVYSRTGILVDQSTMPVPISLTNLVTSVSFQFINTTAAQVGITSNGITQQENGFTSFLAANDTSYTFSASIYDASLGKNVNYTGSFIPRKPSYTIYINATAPLAEVILNANAYSGSQLGELSSSGSDQVLMTVDGIPTE